MIGCNRSGHIKPAAGVLLAVTWLAGCAGVRDFDAVPIERTNAAEIAGIPNARFVSDGGEPARWAAEALAARKRRLAYLRPNQGGEKVVTALALSGGGQDGAFGAGLLVGWSEHGARPDFDFVTGVSAGALIAPFAFLGRDYDRQLQELFTSIDENDILRSRPFTAALTDDAIYDTAPLFARIQTVIDAGMLARIGEEYRRGRLLLIASTNLASGRPVVWNIGAIADSGRPEAADLIHKILLASSAIPALFPPVLIDVDIDGQRRQELHVDGGTVTQAFLYPPTLHVRDLEQKLGVHDRVVAYVIRNGRLRPSAVPVNRQTLSIAGRAVSTMISFQGIGDLYRTFALAKRDHIDVRFTAIGDDFAGQTSRLFDREYMTGLFEFGRHAGRSGIQWSRTPPGYDPPSRDGHVRPGDSSDVAEHHG
jgi:predicted acylesterase/phospholipase RssA